MHHLKSAAHNIMTSALLVAITASNAFAGDIVPGHTAIWYDPDRSGEGWVLEVLHDDSAVAYWFTYDESGKQRWVVGSGSIVESPEGSRIDLPELFISSGGQFGEGFDPDSVVLENVGSASFSFDDCFSGRVEVQALGYADTVQISRLTKTMGAGCSPINGVAGEPVLPFAGQTGSWFDPTHNGEGFINQWMANGSMITYWFTYDDQGNQAWMLGVGEKREDDTVDFQEVLKPEGAKFGNAFDPDDVELLPWGMMSMQLACEAGTVSYDSSLGPFGSGAQDLQRLTRVAQPACPYEKPELSDLYQFSWQDIPIGTDENGSYEDIRAQSVSDQGAVVAHKLIGPSTSAVMLWRPETEQWERLGALRARSGSPLLIAPSGKLVVTDEKGDINDPNKPSRPMIWDDFMGWQAVESNVLARNTLFGASDNRQAMVGTGRAGGEGDLIPWVWRPETGVVALPETENLQFLTPYGASNDGDIVVGHNLFIVEGTSILSAAAVRWVNGGDPELLYDDTGALLASVRFCNADCSVLIGVGQAELVPDHPNAGETWVWIAGKTTYLGTLLYPGSETITGNFSPYDTSSDGSLIVGEYTEMVAEGFYASPAFIWTQATGLVSMGEVLEELALDEGPWNWMRAASVSSSGDKILLVGESRIPGAGAGDRRRAAILTMMPIAQD